MSLIVGTHVVGADEPALRLTEGSFAGRDGLPGVRRYRILTVWRNDRRAEMWQDLGPDTDWEHLESFSIVGGWVNPNTGRPVIVHTAGQLMEMAGELHVRNGYAKAERRDELAFLEQQLAKELNYAN